MPSSEEVYDILDVIRVVKSVWVAAVVVSATAACLVALWVFPGIKEPEDIYGVEVILTMPSESVGASDVRREILAIADASGAAGSAFAPAIDEIASELAPSYRSVRVMIVSPASREQKSWLDEAIRNLSVAVDQYDADIKQQIAVIENRRRMIEGFLDSLATPRADRESAVTTAASAAAAASLLSVLSEQEDDARELAARGRGPLIVVRPESPSAAIANLQWLRFPIAAGFAGLLAVVFFGFTVDGIRVAEARRRQNS